MRCATQGTSESVVARTKSEKKWGKKCIHSSFLKTEQHIMDDI